MSATPNLALAHVYLDCPLVKNTVIVGVRENALPAPEVTFLLGNDLMGTLE